MSKFCFLLIFIVIVFNTFSFAGTIDPDITDAKYISYGDKFLYIGQITGLTHDDEPYYASGVAYKDNIIITAAHVLSSTKNQIVSINNKLIEVDKFIIHEKYNAKNFGYYDIGIIKLKKNIDLDWYPSLYEAKDEVGKVCSLSGFGATGTFATGSNRSDKYRRAGSNMIDNIDRGMLICTPSINIKKTELEFMIAPGDSGGGLFIGNKLAGIHSCIMAEGHKAKSDYKTESGHTRISDHVEWIKVVMAKIQNEKK